MVGGGVPSCRSVPTMYLLLIDLLGVKARWARGTADAAIALEAFDEFVLTGLSEANATPRTGGIDSDAAAFVFDELDDALRAAQGIYVAAFTAGEALADPRYWIRGVILHTDTDDTRRDVSLPPPFAHLTRSDYTEPLMDAVCVEASGHLKGMRVIVQSSLVDTGLRDRFAIKTRHGHLVPFRRLDMTHYPDGDWQDYLWMVPSDPDNWTEIDAIARNRMRGAGPDGKELDQAAHTRVVFDQVGAMLVMQHFRGR